MNGKTEEGTKASMCSTASLKHALSFPPPQRAQLQCNQNQGEGPAVATNQEHSPLEYKARVAKLWGPYVAMKGIYKFSLSAPCRSTDDGLETKFPTRGEGRRKRKKQLGTHRRQVHLPHLLNSIPLPFFPMRRQFNFTTFKKLPIRKLRFPVHFYCIFQGCVIRVGHIPMGAECPKL